jgi:hypothetical protein
MKERNLESLVWISILICIIRVYSDICPHSHSSVASCQMASGFLTAHSRHSYFFTAHSPQLLSDKPQLNQTPPNIGVPAYTQICRPNHLRYCAGTGEAGLPDLHRSLVRHICPGYSQRSYPEYRGQLLCHVPTIKEENIQAW